MSTTPLAPLPIRLAPGDDLRDALDAAVAACGAHAAFVVSGIGSLARAAIRYAGAESPTVIEADLEILTLAGTIAINGSHLHATLADAQGRVCGGHVAPGCIVRTTAEVLVVLLGDGWQFRREPDVVTGYAELSMRRS